MSGMRKADNLSEWQLQAVLYKAKLTQYFEIFISQGGDDIDQIMQCEEQEFLEIMSLVGMSSKPLHVRRFQRTLSEFSLNRAQFLMNAAAFIGLPPTDFPCSSLSKDNLAAALQFLIPGFLPEKSEPACFSANTLNEGDSDCSNFRIDDFLYEPTSLARQTLVRSNSPLEVTSPILSVSQSPILSTNTMCSKNSATPTATQMISATANVLSFPDNILMNIVNASSNSQPNIPFNSSPITVMTHTTLPPSIPPTSQPITSDSIVFNESESLNSPILSNSGTLPQLFQQFNTKSNQTTASSSCDIFVPTTSLSLSSDTLALINKSASFSSNSSILNTLQTAKSPIAELYASFTTTSLIPQQQFSPPHISPINSIAPSTSSKTNYASIPLDTPTNADRNNLPNTDASLMIYQLFEMPAISESDIRQLAGFAQILSDKLPKLEPRFMQNKRKISRELLNAMSLKTDHPQRLLQFRRFSAIYGRFDTKRKPDNALTFHEALVNEAAAQLCLCRPELLTRRDELFPLARKLVQISGFRGLNASSRSSQRFKHCDNERNNDCHSETGTKSNEHSRSPSQSSMESRSSFSPTPSTANTSDINYSINELKDRSNTTTLEMDIVANAKFLPLANPSTSIDVNYLQKNIGLKKNELFKAKAEDLLPESSATLSHAEKKCRNNDFGEILNSIVQSVPEEQIKTATTTSNIDFCFLNA